MLVSSKQNAVEACITAQFNVFMCWVLQHNLITCILMCKQGGQPSQGSLGSCIEARTKQNTAAAARGATMERRTATLHS